MSAGPGPYQAHFKSSGNIHSNGMRREVKKKRRKEYEGKKSKIKGNHEGNKEKRKEGRGREDGRQGGEKSFLDRLPPNQEGQKTPRVLNRRARTIFQFISLPFQPFLNCFQFGLDSQCFVSVMREGT